MREAVSFFRWVLGRGQSLTSVCTLLRPLPVTQPVAMETHLTPPSLSFSSCLQQEHQLHLCFSGWCWCFLCVCWCPVKLKTQIPLINLYFQREQLISHEIWYFQLPCYGESHKTCQEHVLSIFHLKNNKKRIYTSIWKHSLFSSCKITTRDKKKFSLYYCIFF